MNKGKIIVLVGISGAGKSFFAHQTWLQNPHNTVIISRDVIRYMFGYTEETVSEYYKRPDLGILEEQVTEYEDVLINVSLDLNKTVIIDATHLSKKYIDRHKFWGVPTELKWFDIHLEEAIFRDLKRTRKVGEEVIKKQYERYLKLREELKA